MRHVLCISTSRDPLPLAGGPWRAESRQTFGVGQGGEKKGWNPPSAYNSDGEAHQSCLGRGTRSGGAGLGLALMGPEPMVLWLRCQGVLRKGAQVYWPPTAAPASHLQTHEGPLSHPPVWAVAAEVEVGGEDVLEKAKLWQVGLPL